jgi:hypothetical protein
MGTITFASEQRPLHSERRHAKLERQRTRRQDREAKRSRTRADELGELATLLDNAGWHPQSAPASTVPANGDSARRPVAEPAASRPAREDHGRRARPPARRNSVQEARQHAADHARDTATTLIGAAIDRAPDRREGEHAAARDALHTLAAPTAAPWTGDTKRIDEAIAHSNAKAIRERAKRALWEAAKDAASTRRSDDYRDGAREACTALAVIERLPMATLRAANPPAGRR